MRVSRSLCSVLKSVEAAAQSFMETHGGKAIIRTQKLDGNQLRLLSLTLNRPHLYKDVPVVDAAPKDGTPVPPGYHLVYFTPAVLEPELTPAGSEGPYNADPPFTRRMWAGGKISWNDPSNPLRIGDEVTETTRAPSASVKKTKAGDDMIVVSVEKVFSNAKGINFVDNRQWLFRKGLSRSQGRPSSQVNYRDAKLPQSEQLPGTLVRDFKQTPVSLFRFSALTFNPHKIHWYTPWTVDVEGYRDLVVHGPMNLVNMLDVWRDLKGGQAWPASIDYRLTSPVYVDEPYRITMGPADGVNEGTLTDAAEAVGMRATIADA